MNAVHFFLLFSIKRGRDTFVEEICFSLDALLDFLILVFLHAIDELLVQYGLVLAGHFLLFLLFLLCGLLFLDFFLFGSLHHNVTY